MADQPADVPTACAETDSLLDRGHRPRRLSRKQTRHSARAATRNAAKFDEESPHSRYAEARAVNETLPLGAVLAPRLASRRLVHYNVSPTSSNTCCVHTLANGFSCGFSSISASSSRARHLSRSATNEIVPSARSAASQSVRASKR